jgi:adenylosuccinate lyase
MTEETHTSLSAFDLYVDPIAQRYASKTMQALFSPMHRARVWRDLWIVLAEAEHELGLPVTAAQVRELREQRDAIDLERVAEHEKQLRHDVMAHIHAYGEVAPGARGIIHLGATSCFVTDNADLIILRRGLDLVSDRLLRSIHALARFCRENAHRPALGLTSRCGG